MKGVMEAREDIRSFSAGVTTDVCAVNPTRSSEEQEVTLTQPPLQL